MPACACQHFQAGKKTAPGKGELMWQRAEGSGSCGVGEERCKDEGVETTEV